MSESRSAYLYLLIGAVAGFLLGSATATGWLNAANKVISVSAILSLAVFGKRVEREDHAKNIESWDQIRSHGMLHFVLLRYVLLRGGLLSIVFWAPMWNTIVSTSGSYEWVILITAFLTAMLSYLGIVEWKDCESKFGARLLRDLAEEDREATSRTN